MGEDESPKPSDHPDLSGMMDYDTISSKQRELTPENLKSAADLIGIAMKIVEPQEADKKTGFKTAYVMTKKITSTNPNEGNFYVRIRDFNDPIMDYTEGLLVEYKKTGLNQELISEGQWTLPRSDRLAEEEYLGSLTNKNQDWEIVSELVQDLKNNYDANKDKMYIDEDRYEKSVQGE